MRRLGLWLAFLVFFLDEAAHLHVLKVGDIPFSLDIPFTFRLQSEICAFGPLFKRFIVRDALSHRVEFEDIATAFVEPRGPATQIKAVGAGRVLLYNEREIR